MKCLLRGVAVAVILGLAAQGAFAAPLFVNPGFESGDFTGWTVTFSATGGPNEGTLTGMAPADTDGSGATEAPQSGYEDAVVVPVGWGTDPYTADNVSKVAPPSFGPNNYSARIGDAGNQIDAAGTGSDDDDPQSVTLSQVGTVTELVAGLSVQWSAGVTEPLNFDEHEVAGYPSFHLRVENLTQATVLLDVEHSSQELGSFWQSDGAQGVVDDPNNRYEPTRFATEGTWWYQDWTQESWDMSAANLGDQILIELTAQDCGLRGHPAYVRLDDIGQPPTDIIPEPTTMLLLIGGLAAAGWRIRRRVA
jgi:hypothetical protein